MNALCVSIQFLSYIVMPSLLFFTNIATTLIFIFSIIFFISGVFRGGHEVLLRAKLALAEGVTMQLTVRTTNAEIAELVTSAIG